MVFSVPLLFLCNTVVSQKISHKSYIERKKVSEIYPVSPSSMLSEHCSDMSSFFDSVQLERPEHSTNTPE